MLSSKDFSGELNLGKKLLIFDVDDTLIDTSESYDQAIKETVEHFTGIEIKDEKLSLVRRDGLSYGVNNDWNVTFLLISLINDFPNQNWSEVLKAEKLAKIDIDSDFYKEIKDHFQNIYLGNPPFSGDGLIDTKEKPMWRGEGSQFFEDLVQMGFKLAVVTSRPGEEAFYTLYEVNKLEEFFPRELIVHADSVRVSQESFETEKSPQAPLINPQNTSYSDPLEGVNSSETFQTKGGVEPIQEKPSPEPILEVLRLTGIKPYESIYIGNSSSDYVASRDAGVDFWQVGQSEISRDFGKEVEGFVYKKIKN
jgi:phosphoglycolate phosphatase-like HAD superfamily hydrolase